MLHKSIGTNTKLYMALTEDNSKSYKKEKKDTSFNLMSGSHSLSANKIIIQYINYQMVRTFPMSDH